MFNVLTISTIYYFFLVRKVCLVTDRYGNDTKREERGLNLCVRLWYLSPTLYLVRPYLIQSLQILIQTFYYGI